MTAVLWPRQLIFLLVWEGTQPTVCATTLLKVFCRDLQVYQCIRVSLIAGLEYGMERWNAGKWWHYLVWLARFNLGWATYYDSRTLISP